MLNYDDRGLFSHLLQACYKLCIDKCDDYVEKYMYAHSSIFYLSSQAQNVLNAPRILYLIVIYLVTCS